MGIIAQQAAELISAQFERIAGPPGQATGFDLAPCWDANFLGQVCHPLAYFAAREFPGNRWFGHAAILAAARAASSRLLDEMRRAEHWESFRRSGHPLIHAFALLRPGLDDPDDWKRGIVEVVGRLFLPLLQERERLTVLSSANVGYGTNHLACELSAVTAYVSAFREDENWARMNPGGPGLEEYVRRWLARFMDYMDEAGYWPETDGPANAYNTLTASALLRAAMDLGEVETYRSHFERVAHFHSRYLLPNFLSVGVTDGRNRQIDCSGKLAYAAFLPEGKALLERVGRVRLAASGAGRRFTGEMLNEVLTEILAEPFFHPKDAPLLWDAPSYRDTIRDDFAVFKQGPWVGALSNFRFRPRPEGHWTLDHQNLFSLYHERFGVVFSGSNGKNDPDLSTFNKRFTSFDSKPLQEPLWSYVPGRGRFDLRADGFRLLRDYRGFEGILDLTIRGPTSATLEIQANARMSEYPITCSLQPAAGFRRGFRAADGRTIEIGEQPLCLRGHAVGGVMILSPERVPDVRTDAPGRSIRLAIPDDAEMVWPYKAWDCYNTKTDRYEKPADWTLLLKIPVGPQGARIDIEVL